MKKTFLLYVGLLFSFVTANAQWALNGNAIVDSNFIGSTNAIPLTIKVGNLLSGYIGNVIYGNTLFGYGVLKTGSSNTGFGYQTFHSMTTGTCNAGLGYQALYNVTSGNWNVAIGNQPLYLNTTGNYNVGVGSGALYTNSSGSLNVGIGLNTAYSITTGNNNSILGSSAMFSNTTGSSNSVVGMSALYKNTTLSNIVAVGDSALYSLTGGSGYNTALGSKALYTSTTGGYNTAVGYHAGCKLSTGSYNTALGYNALTTGATSNYNTAIGYAADISYDTITNSTALGNGAVVNASNKIRLGNAAVTSFEVSSIMYVTSDKRFKTDFSDDVKGLEFIRKLHPVQYRLQARKLDEFRMKKLSTAQRENILHTSNYGEAEGILRTGFIAQEVEAAAKSVNFNFDGIHAPKNDDDNYSLSYTAFVVPLVKGVQQLSNVNDSLCSVIDSLKDAQKVMQAQIVTILTELNKLKAGKSLADGAKLLQNAPNPFNSSTVINYFLPDNAASAQLVITDASGRVLKDVVLSGRGQGQAVIHAGELASGTYFYSLVVNDQRVATKTMVLTR